MSTAPRPAAATPSRLAPPAAERSPAAAPFGSGGRLVDLAADPQIRRTLIRHARRGLSVQSQVRVALAVFQLLTLALLPPPTHAAACWALALAYLVLAAGFLVATRRAGEATVRWGWLALLGDIAILGAVTMLAGASVASWTTDVLVWGFFVVPLLASTQLRPGVSSLVCVPTVAVYLAVGAAGRIGNGDEPWASILLRTAALAIVSVGAVLLSRVQRSRVLAVGRLAEDRVALVQRLVDTEQRERRDLSERLHDGALQYLLAARMDLEDLQQPGVVDAPDPARHAANEALERLHTALTQSVRLLRSTVSELHPAVLAQSGLRPAITELVHSTSARGALLVELDATGWPLDARTSADDLLYATCRELLSNVVRHSGARHATVTLTRSGDRARLTVTDDGRGFTEQQARLRLADGHVGLAARRARVEAVGGRLVVGAGSGSPDTGDTGRDGGSSGAVVEVEVPATELTAGPYRSTVRDATDGSAEPGQGVS